MEKQINLENVHWADNSAQRVIDTFPNEKVYTVASGITPSGYIHVGNFREVITSEMVRRALEDKGKKTKFIYSWDSYDAFRKVPNDVPQEWSKYLRMPVGIVPNPFGSGTYGGQFMKYFEDEVEPFKFPVIFQKQHEIQTSGAYADHIKNVLQNKHIVIEELNKYREVPFESSWWPVDVYDDESQKDETEIISYDGEYTITYTTKEGIKKKVNFKENPRVKLRWKADWPMRWAFYGVCFEPGGKDHSTPGSSYTTGKEIVKRIFNREPPVYTAYDWVRVKGMGGKISSSKGGALRIKDVLEVYTPEMILYIFASTRPNAEFDISFDADVIKLYEDFDKLERLYFGLEEEKNDKKRETLRRTYELSMVNGVNLPTSLPAQFPMRHLSVIAQVNNFNYEKVENYYEEELKTEFDKQRLKQRFECVKNWLEKHAPEEFVFSINQELKVYSEEEKEILLKLKEILPSIESGKELMPKFKDLSKQHNMEVKDFFTMMYRIFISKEKGPKLGGFLIENKELFLNILSNDIVIEKPQIKEKKQREGFEKLALQIGEVVDVKKHTESEKLYIFKINLGKETRQILSGIQKYYTEEELMGKKVVVVVNLKEAKLAGEISQGMILAVEEKNKVKLLSSILNVGSYLKVGELVADNESTVKFKDFETVVLESKKGDVYFGDQKIYGISVEENLSGRVH